MKASRGMGAIAPSKVPKVRTTKKKDGNLPVKLFKHGGKVRRFDDGGGIKDRQLSEGNAIIERTMREFQKTNPPPTVVPPRQRSPDVLSDDDVKDLSPAQLMHLLDKRKEQEHLEFTRQIPPRGKKQGGSVSRVNEAGNYTKPGMRKGIFNRIKAGGKGGAPGQWSARKAQMMAMQYKKSGGGYKD